MEVSEQSAGLRRYGDVLRAPGVGRIAAAALLARLPGGMAPLATVLLVRGEGRSYGVAGLVIAASSLASAIGWPLWGRLVDRSGQARVLLPLAVVYPATLAGLALSATYGAPALVLVAFAALSGATMPPVGACMRALWPSLLGSKGLRDTAYALEAWLQELFFIVGPLIVALIATVAPPGPRSRRQPRSPGSAPSGSRSRRPCALPAARRGHDRERGRWGRRLCAQCSSRASPSAARSAWSR